MFYIYLFIYFYKLYNNILFFYISFGIDTLLNMVPGKNGTGSLFGQR